MIVLISRNDVEDRPSELFDQIGIRESKLAHDVKRLFVAVDSGHVEVVVSQCGKGLQVKSVAIDAVEALGHEVSSALFFEQPGAWYSDARFSSHQCVGMFDAAIAKRVGEFLVAISVDSVELK